MSTPMSPNEVVGARDLFWRNVMREILTSLSVASMHRKPGEGEELFDGRMAILTHGGERIPIADVYPLFACGIPTSDHSRTLSAAVECSVFQIRTPAGEVFTLPVQEMRGFHAMSAELMKQLEAQTAAHVSGVPEEPFGFAAFTSMAREMAETEEKDGS